MTLSIQNVGRVRADEEANGSFCAEATLGSMEDVPYVEGSLKVEMDRPFETPKLIQQHIDGYPSKVPMPRRGKASMQLNLRGTTARGTGALTSANVVPLGRHLFKIGMGAATFGTGTTIASTSTSTVLNLTSAAGLSEGGALVCATGAGGALECREIKTISTNQVTLKLPLSSAPSNGSTVYSCVTFSLGNLDGSTVTSLQLLVEGWDTGDRWLLKGGQLASPPKFNLQPGTIPTVDFDFMFADHKKADGSETTMNPNSALADQAYSDASIVAVMDSELRIHTHGVSTLSVTSVDASDINVVPNIAYIPQLTPGGTNNIKQWVRARPNGPAVTGDFLLPYESAAWRTLRDAETSLGFFYQVGSSTTSGGFMVSVPHIVVDNFQREDVGGIAGQRVSWYARLDNQTNTNSTALQKSALRLHVF
jgi:hypothetical protein